MTENSNLNYLDVTDYSSTSDIDTSAISLQRMPSQFIREQSHQSTWNEHPNSAKRHHRFQCPFTQHKGTSSLLNVTFNMLNSIIGTGILGIPYIYKNGGIFGCALLMFLFGICVIYTWNILIISGKRICVFNYEILIEECFGLTGYCLCCLCIVILNFGGMITFLIIINDALLQLLLIFNLDSYDTIVMLILSLTIILPPCLLRDLSALEKISFVKMTSLLMIILVVFIEFGTPKGTKSRDVEYTLYFGSLNMIPNIIGIIAFTLVCHDSSFLLYQTLKTPTKQRWFTLSVSGIFGAAFFILLLTIPCYLTFGNIIQCNMLNNYEIHDPLVIIMRIIFIITLSLTYPSAFFLVRHILYSAIQRIYAMYKHGYENTMKVKKIMKFKRMKCLRRKKLEEMDVDITEREGEASVEELDERKIKQLILLNEMYTVQSAPKSHHLFLTMTIFVANLVCGMYMKNLGVVMGVIGSLSSVNLAFVFPCLCFLKTYDWKEIQNTKSITEKCFIVMNALPAICLVIVGLILAVYGVIASVNI